MASLLDIFRSKPAPVPTRSGRAFALDEIPSMTALVALPSPAPPKVPSSQQSLPSYLRTAKPSTTSPLLRVDRGLASLDVSSYRLGADSREVIRNFTRASPELSAAVGAYVRTGITSNYTAVAKNLDGTCNPEASSTLMQLIARMDVLNDYTIGFDSSYSLRTICEIWARDIVTQGAMCGELVLDKARLPDKIQPIATQQIRMFPSADGKRLIPQQFVGGHYIPLDVPTFFMVTLDPDLLEAYPVSMIESAIQAVIFSGDFMNDLRRVVRKALHPRATVTIDEEKFRKGLPQDVTTDSTKLKAYMESMIGTIESRISTLAPEDVLVMFDTMGFDIANGGNTNLQGEYEAVQGMADSRLIAGAKVLPTVLGKGGGTSNVASTEAMMFVKYVEGAVWGKLNEMLSKMFTLGVRLLGHDVYVEFRFNSIDLRPEAELESFKSMKQSRMLELLSLGFISDEECGIALAGVLPPSGFKPLSGTGFFSAKVAPAGSKANGATNNGSTLNQNLNPSGPTGTKGKNK